MKVWPVSQYVRVPINPTCASPGDGEAWPVAAIFTTKIAAEHFVKMNKDVGFYCVNSPIELDHAPFKLKENYQYGSYGLIERIVERVYKE